MSMLQYLQTFLHTLTSRSMGPMAGARAWRGEEGHTDVSRRPSDWGQPQTIVELREQQHSRKAGQRVLRKVAGGTGSSNCVSQDFKSKSHRQH